jgi:hypothetical protein
MHLKRHIITIISACVFIGINSIHAQNTTSGKLSHEITIYAIPTLYPLDWTSPSTLYTSMKSCYFKTIGIPDNYLLGHIAVRISTPQLSKPLLIAMTSADPMEKVDLVLKQKVGYGILGAVMKGRLESEKELEHKLKVYAMRKKLAFLKFRVSEQATKRILQFIDVFSSKMNDHQAPCNFYSGAFWPRYHMEGSGCSAFGMSLLDVAQVIPDVAEQWVIRINVQKNLIGGEYNNKKRIANRLLKRTHQWHDGSGEVNIDYVPYFVYEPSIMFDWIVNNQNTDDASFTPIVENGVPGIMFDKSEIPTDLNEPIFYNRTEKNLYIDYYFRHKADTITN